MILDINLIRSLEPPFAIYTQFGLNLFSNIVSDIDCLLAKGKIFFPSPPQISQLKFWKTIYGIFLQLIHGTGIFLGVFQATVPEEAYIS